MKFARGVRSLKDIWAGNGKGIIRGFNRVRNRNGTGNPLVNKMTPARKFENR